MASLNVIMTQAMNNPTVLITGLVVGYIGAKLQRKMGNNSMGGGAF